MWAVVIFVAISIHPERVPDPDPLRWRHTDKLVHFGLFAVFGALVLAGFARASARVSPPKKHLLISMTIGCVYGAATELFQYLFLDLRHGSFNDALVDCFGTVFGVMIMRILWEKGLVRMLPPKTKNRLG